MKKAIWALIIVVVVVVVGFFIIKNSKNTPSQGEMGKSQTIKIGAALSLSGAAVQDGENMKAGLELAKADLAKKGINVEIIYQDDKTESKDTVSALNYLKSQNVQAVVGPTWSFLGDAGVPVADRLKLVLVQPANTSEYVSAKSPYSFFTTLKVAQIIPTLTDWLKQNNKKTIAIVRGQGAWYDVVGKAVETSAQQAGAKIVFVETVPYGAEADAMATIVTKLKAAKADLIFTEIDDDAGIVIMLKKMKEQGITAPVMSVTTAVGRVVKSNDVPANLANKFYVISPITSKEFQDKFKAAYNRVPGAYADRAYDSLMVLVDAIEKKGTTELNQYLRDTTNYSGYAGMYNFDANGDIEGGEWVVETIK